MERDREEKLLRAMGDVGDDLVEMAGNYRVSAGWKRWGAVAASLALVICLTAVALPYLPMGCSSADKSAPEAMEPSIRPDISYEPDMELLDRPVTPQTPPAQDYADKENAYTEITTQSTVTYAVNAMDMQYLTETVVTPLVRWQVERFASAADLSEDGLERLYLAVAEQEMPLQEAAAASVGTIRKKLSQVLEGIHIYAPLNRKLPIDGALKELPLIEPQFLHVSGQTVRLDVLVDGKPLYVTLVVEDDCWRYVSVQ